MNIHILGICGTFMGSLALLARELGHEVSGSDMNMYPPMSTQLENSGIPLVEGYVPENLPPSVDLFIIGNTLSRGNPCVEYVLNQGFRYTSGPQWLSEQVLHGRHVMAVSGTHGKTTTTTMLAWILEAAGRQPGFLIGGVAENFGLSARLGDSPLFVVEADEYDSAFFDKRSKFVHYRPKTLIINNIEYDHADIFSDIAAIRREFHHLVRTLPGNGLIIAKHAEAEIEQVLDQGCWTPLSYFGSKQAEWCANPLKNDYSAFEVLRSGKVLGVVEWKLIGRYNAENALAAIAAAQQVNVSVDTASQALTRFKSVKRRLQSLACVNGVTLYDDFAHHPTAIQLTLEALKQHLAGSRVIAILEPRSNTMKLGVHKERLAQALSLSDYCFIYRPKGLQWDLAATMRKLGDSCEVYDDTKSIIDAVCKIQQAGDHIVIMSNGGFENIHERLISRLQMT